MWPSKSSAIKLFMAPLAALMTCSTSRTIALFGERPDESFHLSLNAFRPQKRLSLVLNRVTHAKPPE